MKLVLEKDQNLFFTSDTHYGHSNICRATTNWTDADNVTRDFNSLEDMNDTIVNNINSIVGENDILIHLGDWSFGGFDNIAEFRNRIVCKNIHLTYGNHDHHIRNNKYDIQSLFSSTQDYMLLDIRRPSIISKGQVDKYRFVVMHFPIASWDGMNDKVIHLHGHVHLPNHLRVADGKAMDVGVDGNFLKPIDLDEVLFIMKNQPIDKLCLPCDHHVKRLN
jgi:calcineurin-like phosphoesterase family protein